MPNRTAPSPARSRQAVSQAVPSLPALLQLLADGRPQSGPELARRLRISRAAVWKQIEALRAAGLDVLVDASGYRLATRVDGLDIDGVRAALPARTAARLGVLENHWQLDSTSSEVARRADALPDLSCVFAEWQHAGRGRRGRAWQSPPAMNLQFSCLKRFGGGYAALAGLSLAVGVAIARALEDTGVAGIGLKWPNDLVSGDAKLGGILIELGGEFMGPCHAVIGVGINVRLPAAMRAALDRACIDLAQLTGGEAPSRNQLAAAMLARLVEALDAFDANGFAAFHAEWSRRDALAGRTLRVDGARGMCTGVGHGVDARGALQVQTAQGLQTIDSAEVSVCPA